MRSSAVVRRPIVVINPPQTKLNPGGHSHRSSGLYCTDLKYIHVYQRLENPKTKCLQRAANAKFAVLARNGKVETESEILNELIANLATEDKHALGSINRQFLRHLDESNYQHTWSPLSNRHSFSMPQPPGAGISTIHRLEQLYASRIGFNPPAVERRQRHSVVSRPSQRSHEVSVQLSPPQPVSSTQSCLVYPECSFRVFQRPRFASMPSQVGKDEPARDAAIQVASSKRFTVTPARVDEQT